MRTLGRLLCSIGVAAVLLLQPAAALAAPTPSPGLDGILLKPPGTGYKEETKTAVGVLEGPFDAAKYAVATGAKDGTQTTQALTRDGFVSGYGRTWFSAGSAHVWVMAVIAFTGAQGAKTFLKESEAADKGDVNYSQALTMTAIDTYYGARLIDKVHKVYGDVFGFVKGNDVLLVTFVSNKNDLATVAATQTKKQYDAAPRIRSHRRSGRNPRSQARRLTPSRPSASSSASFLSLASWELEDFSLVAPPAGAGHSAPGPARVCVHDFGRASCCGRDSCFGRDSCCGCGSRRGRCSSAGRPFRDVRRPPIMVGRRHLERR